MSALARRSGAGAPLHRPFGCDLAGTFSVRPSLAGQLRAVAATRARGANDLIHEGRGDRRPCLTVSREPTYHSPAFRRALVRRALPT
jgi:hypothetical protein